MTAPRATFTIRRAEQKDASELASLFAQDAMLGFTDVPPHTGTSYWEKRIGDHVDAAHLPLVAVAEGAIVGISLLRAYPNHIRRKHQAVLTLLAVHPSHRKQGVGRALIEATSRACDDWLSVRRIEVSIDDVAPLRKFYERLGFVSEGVCARARLHAGRYVDQRFMARINPANMPAPASPTPLVAKRKSHRRSKLRSGPRRPMTQTGSPPCLRQEVPPTARCNTLTHRQKSGAHDCRATRPRVIVCSSQWSTEKLSVTPEFTLSLKAREKSTCVAWGLGLLSRTKVAASVARS